MSHLIYAAADILLVPSMFEPCGLTQMIAMRCAPRALPLPRCRSLAPLREMRPAPHPPPACNNIGIVSDFVQYQPVAVSRAAATYSDASPSVSTHADHQSRRASRASMPALQRSVLTSCKVGICCLLMRMSD